MIASTKELNKFLLAQFAAESHLHVFDHRDVDKRVVLLRDGYNHPDYYEKLTTDGELSAVQMTDLMITDFDATWEIVHHRANTNSGVSATLLRERDTENYTLSLRSTQSRPEELGGDALRDAGAGAGGEINADGFAWAQIRDMQEYLEDLKSGEFERLNDDPYFDGSLRGFRMQHNPLRTPGTEHTAANRQLGSATCARRTLQSGRTHDTAEGGCT